MITAAPEDVMKLVPPAGQIVERLAEIETEAKLLRRMLPLALDAQRAREQLREQRSARGPEERG